MRTSNELMKSFAEHKLSQIQDNKINFHVHMLTASYWPAYPPCKAILPKEMLACTTAFSKFYNYVYNSRKIIWQTRLGTGTIIGRYPAGRFELMVSTYQMITLMLFNDNDKLTFQQILEKTKIQEKVNTDLEFDKWKY